MKYTSAFVGDLSGSVGGLTASRARGGIDYFRFRATPTNPSTQRQQVVRGAIATLTDEWALLSQDERDTWIQQADESPTQGLNRYVAANVPRLQVGLARVDEFDAALANGLGAVTGVTNSGPVLSIVFNASGWANINGTGLLLYIQRPVPPSRTFENRYRLLGSILGNSTTPPTSPQSRVSPWGQSFQPGWTSIIRVRGVDPAGRYFSVANLDFTWA